MMRLALVAAVTTWILASCSEPSAAARGDGAVANTPSAATSTVQGKAIAMSASKPCGNSNLERSLCMVELMIADIRQNYDWPSGGGIGDIKQTSSTSYTVSLPQEERADLFTYEFTVTGKTVTIKSKTPGTQSY